MIFKKQVRYTPYLWCKERWILIRTLFTEIVVLRALNFKFKSRFWPIFRVRRWMEMATRRSLLQNESSSPSHSNDPGRDLFEACRNGDLNKVKKLVNHHNVNAKDTAGRKSSPLHFAAGMTSISFCFGLGFAKKLRVLNIFL